MFVVGAWTGLLAVLVLGTDVVQGEPLTPPYFNLAEGKKITATATCGVDTTDGPELYCKLVGAHAENDLNVNVIQGQYCDYCDPTRPDKMHPPEFAVDGMETWWQSPPLSRGMKYNEVNLTIDLGQEFHVAYVFIRMGNSPRPGLWVLEKSADYGKTYTPWQYFSDSPGDCQTYFGKESLQPITRDDSVICTTEYSKIVPLEGGEIPISLLNNRPSANHYFNSTVLQEWTRATNVRFRLLRTKNFLGHLMSMARQDPTVTRRYFYSIKDISIGGRCMCNGHADTCDIQDPQDQGVLLCRCQHNTCGAKCDSCCPGFEQKKWRQSKVANPFACEPCNCFLHSNECVYDEEVDQKGLSLDIHGRYAGGGVCQNCQHNTEGINCNKCKSTFYRPYNKHWNETDVCQPCRCNQFYSTGNCAEGSGMCECKKEFTPPNCDSCSFGYFGYPKCRPCECFLNGTQDLQCEALNGQCPCLYNFGGQYCKECSPGFYSFPDCKQCECNAEGSVTQTCDQTSGNCTCKNNFGGRHCSECQDGYFGYPTCSYCNCDIKGTQEGICDKSTGQCICKEGYGGDRCDVCLLGFYDYPNCKPCNCTSIGSLGFSCGPTGKCSCQVNYAGKTCDQCSPGYYKFPECLPCECDGHGANGVSCDAEGKCECHHNFAGQRCGACKEGFYNFPACEDCNCHPAGVVAGFAGCGSVPAGELCQCKERVEGRICDKCRPLYWNLNPNNPEGCEECKCNVPGVLGGMAVCDADHGECVCKSLVVARGCSECADGTYKLQEENLFGCSDCECDVGGSINNICDKISGQCLCQSRVTGRTCKEPLQAHYFPTLYQYQYEVEDGRTPANTLVRYAYDENVFPQYSWKGYAVFSNLQNVIIQDIYIYKPSFYRMVLRYVNSNPDTVIGKIKITPDNPTDNEQEFQVQFKNTTSPAFITVSGASGSVPSLFVMDPGRWRITIEVKRNLLIDYFVLLPEDFYSATILRKKVEKPCTIDKLGLCRDYTYLNLTQFPTTYGVGGYVQEGRKINKIREYFQNTEHLSKMAVANRVPLLNLVQPNLSFNVTVNKPGKYIIVIRYVTPEGDSRTHNMDVVVNSGRHTNMGKAVLYSCPYTSLCRQIITTPDGILAVQQVDGNEIQVNLRSSNADVGIHSIVAIPYEEWSLDYIKPKSLCVRKDGECLSASFPSPPETKKIQFDENNADVAVTLLNTTYMWLNPNYDTLDLKGKVPSPGYYTFIVHYYQPNFQDFDVTVLMQNGQFYEGSLPVPYCPSLSGCRAVITQNDGNNKFALTENFMLTLKEPDHKNVYLDYLLVVPSDFYNERYLRAEDIDRTGQFIATCGYNHFNVDLTKEGFCRDSVFSITAGHNSGALPCHCDYGGSLSFECEKFGGQCKCKPNIIGRKCEACKTGYFGFPDCKPCNCPSTAYCEPTMGQCICPSHVTGEKCDQCEPLTYGFDPIIGCEQCKCHVLGIEGSEQCDLFNGSCSCKRHIVGRQCDKCLAGHYLFPYCDYCACDSRGTTSEICDQDTAECFCKKHVVGPRCETCREGTFNLQQTNEDGCTECFCFGKTTRCISSKLIKTSRLQMSDWQLVGINASLRLEIYPLNLTVEAAEENTIGAIFPADVTENNATVYFTAPSEYVGKKLTSYGGFLNYTLFYTIMPGQGSAVSEPDLILEGRKTYLTYSSFEQPTAAVSYSASVQLVEENFELPTGMPARRDHIMEVLEDLRGIYIRATYWTASVTTRLSNVVQDDAIPYQSYVGDNRNLVFALTVEECRCPENYQGLSCEECAPGFYRVEAGAHGGYCAPCQCHGHASECDVNTGKCFNCTHNTRGDHCELCEVGYHGNALAGTPMDCLICACPLPVASNNFATGCEVSSDGDKISCDCVEGYYGARCQSCAAGYFGRPEQLGEYCTPCQCSGNINPDDPASCDTVSGECLRCLNNTSGKACALCAPGFFGDAITLKDCQSCICDVLGTDRCNSYTGECVCKPNVVGEKCDRCEEKHYGFQTGRGCVPCDCADASDSEQCDDVTGQCRCRPGVGGQRCDRCSGGFWNYTNDGCVSCGCKSEYSLGLGCNALTGQCECLQGVIGEKCNQCPHRWVFVPDFGCHQCDSCTHALLDSTDELQHLIGPIIVEFDSANSSFFTRRKLENMRELLKELEPKFAEVDPKQINLDSSLGELEMLEQDSKSLNRKANYSLENSDSLKTNAVDLKEKAEVLFDDVQNAEDDSIHVIDVINKITFQLNKEENPEIESAVNEGQEMLDAIKLYNLTARQNAADEEVEKVGDLLVDVSNFKVPIDYLGERAERIKGNLTSFNDKLDDLYNQTQYSLNKANEAQRIIDKSGKERLKKKLEDIETQAVQSEKNLVESQTFNDNSTKFNQQSRKELDTLQDILSRLEIDNNLFNATLITDPALDQTHRLRPQAERHAKNLTDRAMQLDSLLTESRDISDSAVRAAKAYAEIVSAVKNASDAAEMAKSDATRAVDLLNGVENKTYNAVQVSRDSLHDAFGMNHSTNDDLEPRLQRALEQHVPVKDTHNTNNEKLDNIDKILDNMKGHSLDQTYVRASEKADNAMLHVTNIDDIAKDTFDQVKNETANATLLPKIVHNTNTDLSQAEKQLKTVNDKLPAILQSVDQLPEQQTELQKAVDNISNSLKRLNQQIILARDLANQIKLGMKFYPNTTLELRNPSNLEDLTTSTKISGYFKTNDTYGLLWYLGNPPGTNLRATKTDDYMALIIQNGYPVLKLDVGNGMEQVINDKYVSDDVWYQFIVERTGDNAKLSIREELPGGIEKVHQKETTLEGPLSIFNLDRNKSKLFVGSFPINYAMQKEIDVNPYDGEIEDLVIGEKPVSLWNFNDGTENNHGAIERDKLVNLQPSTGFRFNGNGYAVFNAQSYQLRGKSDIQLSFKTFATEGLLFLAGRNNTFIALELRNGKILYQYNLGHKTKRWHTTKTYNDGKWHVVEASREGPSGRFMVDNEDIPDTTETIKGNAVEPIEIVSFGGYPTRHSHIDVTQIKFDGCIDHVSIMGSPIDMRNNIKAYDFTPGCPVKFSQMVSFDKYKPGYVANGGLSVNNDFKISLKFKTKDQDGLIFYGTDQLNTASISLALKDGRLVLISQKSELRTKETFNDSEWHVVSVIHNKDGLRLRFDDIEPAVTDTSPPQLHFLHGTLYVGGLPRRITPSSGSVASDAPFKGCIGDLTLKGNVLNFANTTDKFNEILGKCTLDKSFKAIDKIDNEPVLPPLQPLEPVTTEHYAASTRSPYAERTTRRGDGGLDFLNKSEEIPVTEVIPFTTLLPTTPGHIGHAVLRPTKPPPKDACALPPDPPAPSPGVWRFGAQKDSRLEIDKTRGRYKKTYDFALDFKSDSRNGIIFYMSDDGLQEHYVAVFLQNGQIVYTFSDGNGRTVIKTDDSHDYSDNKWHVIEFSKDEHRGKLVLDGNPVDDKPTNMPRIELRPPVYVGGVNPSQLDDVQRNLNMTESFRGCVRNLNMNSKPMVIEANNKFGIVPCFDNVEFGAFFGSNGYVRLREPRFKVGESFSVKLDIKPRRDSGVLVAVNGKRDYFVLEMINGNMSFTVENGNGPIRAVYNPPRKFYFCDGQWHSIQAVKSKSVVTLSVDNVFTDPTLGDHSLTSTDTGSALFLGGHRYLQTPRAKGIATKLPYVGCVRNVFVNNEPVEIHAGMAEGDVIVGTCPTD